MLLPVADTVRLRTAMNGRRLGAAVSVVPILVRTSTITASQGLLLLRANGQLQVLGPISNGLVPDGPRRPKGLKVPVRLTVGQLRPIPTFPRPLPRPPCAFKRPLQEQEALPSPIAVCTRLSS